MTPEREGGTTEKDTREEEEAKKEEWDVKTKKRDEDEACGINKPRALTMFGAKFNLRSDAADLPAVQPFTHN